LKERFASQAIKTWERAFFWLGGKDNRLKKTQATEENVYAFTDY
jgi:hypothetical protein